jgi:hypothetical protein
VTGIDRGLVAPADRLVGGAGPPRAPSAGTANGTKAPNAAAGTAGTASTAGCAAGPVLLACRPALASAQTGTAGLGPVGLGGTEGGTLRADPGHRTAKGRIQWPLWRYV